jgi:hypothetical protein
MADELRNRLPGRVSPSRRLYRQLLKGAKHADLPVTDKGNEAVACERAWRLSMKSSAENEGPRYFLGFHSLASLCASAICAGLICAATVSRSLAASVSPLTAAKLYHMYALT